MKMHVIRTALPWRSGLQRTECGRDPRTVQRSSSREDLIASLKGGKVVIGEVCEVCRQKASYNQDVVHLLRRELDRYDESLLGRELRAMSDLVALYPEDFAALMRGKRAPMRQRIEEAYAATRHELAGD